MNPLTYHKAASIFASARNKDKGKKIDNNTYLIQTKGENGEDCYAVRLHWTNVIMFYPDGSIVLDSNNWRTVTTKDRINNYSLARVYQKDYVWYVYDRQIPLGGSQGYKEANSVEFYDGIRLPAPVRL